MPKPDEEKTKEGLTSEDMASEEALAAADKAVTEDVRSMLDDLIDEEKEDEDKDKDKDKDKEEDKDKEKDKEEDKDKSEEEEESEEESEEDEDEKKEDKDKEEEDKDKKGEEDEKEEKEEEDKPKPDVETVTKIAKLEGRIEELSRAALAKDEEEEKKKPALDLVEFISKDRDLAEKPLTVEELNELLNQARTSAYEEAIRNTPELVGTLVKKKLSLDEAVEKFYEENEDLALIKDYVGSAANTIVSEHPDWEIKEILEETEKRVRKALDLEKKAKDTHDKVKDKDKDKDKDKEEDKEEDEEEEDDDKKGKKNTLATKRGSKSGRKGKDTRSEQQRGIDDIVAVGA